MPTSLVVMLIAFFAVVADRWFRYDPEHAPRMLWSFTALMALLLGSTATAATLVHLARAL